MASSAARKTFPARIPLASGTKIEFCGIQAIVHCDDGSDTLEVVAEGVHQVWTWKMENNECAVVS
jgi:hypothetical protein